MAPQYYAIIDFNEVDIRIYLPEKVIIHRGPKLKSITVLLYDFSFKSENFATFTFVAKDMFNLLRHLRTKFSQVSATFIEMLSFSILHFQMYTHVQ